jgi:hypothetical protein
MNLFLKMILLAEKCGRAAMANHSINRTITGRLRHPVIAGYVKR